MMWLDVTGLWDNQQRHSFIIRDCCWSLVALMDATWETGGRRAGLGWQIVAVWNARKLRHHTLGIFSLLKWLKLKQDGPSLESSLYLNLSLRYLGPQDHWTFGPRDLGTLGLWDLFPPPPPPPISSSYTILPPFISSFLLLLS